MEETLFLTEETLGDRGCFNFKGSKFLLDRSVLTGINLSFGGERGITRYARDP